MINGQSNAEIRNTEDAWRRPRADAGSFSVVAADRIGGDPRQLDLWPAPPSKNGAFKAVQAALEGWKPFRHATDKPQPGQGPDHSQPKFLLLDPIGVPAPKPAPAWDEIDVADRDEFVARTPSAVIRAFRPAVVAAGLVVALVLGWAGGWGSYHAFAPAPASAPLERTSVADCALGSGQDGCAAAKSDREAAQAAAPLQKAVPAANGAGRGHEPARAAPQQAAPPPSRDASTAQQAAASPTTTGAVSRERARMSPRPVAVPETRPTTIEGWTVREVVGGTTVVLEGPDGVWRASRGETVPGVGRVDSIVRWGNRWIVATSRGLISTPN
jgi:hypothetical protein